LNIHGVNDKVYWPAILVTQLVEDATIAGISGAVPKLFYRR
jgi:hypothetical protein